MRLAYYLAKFSQMLLSLTNPKSFVHPTVIFAILLTTCISGGYWVTQKTLTNQALDGTVIDIAGRQRMLSQRLLAYAALYKDNDADSSDPKILNQVLTTWEIAHTDLLFGNPKRNIPPPNANQFQALRELSPLIRLASENIEQILSDKAFPIQNLENTVRVYLPKMNSIVEDLAEDSRIKAEKTQITIIMVTVVLLAVLASLILFILVPYQNKNTNLISKLHIQKKEMQQQLKALAAANEGLSQFMYVASHDMKTPLRSIGSFADLIQRRHSKELSKEAAEYFGYIKNNAMSMSSVLDDLVRFNKAGEKRKMQIVDLDLIVRQVKLNLSANLEEIGAILKVGFLGKAHGAEVVISQVLQNLILNAINYRDLERQCHITITRKSTLSGTTLIVTDNGIGLDIKYRNKVFLPFQRVGALDRPGSGIGLSICRKLARSMGGDINYQGKVGVGTSFHFGIDCIPKFEKVSSGQEIEA